MRKIELRKDEALKKYCENRKRYYVPVRYSRIKKSGENVSTYVKNEDLV